ncbi:hypothetical protein ACQ4M4_04170 [Leptolyngbya sp. AN02str]|uniref:hypothetical protein n=1 Tax=Leptolyngbya sp. AN02str TaxID=3423363 RepID=UPI003D31E939
MEQGDTEHPWKEQGALDFGLAYLRQMIDQGLHVAYAVSEAEGGLVHLKVWEKVTAADEHEPIEGHELADGKEPAWPHDNEIIVFAKWEPVHVER